MIAAIVAVREDSLSGPFIGFQVDPQVVVCPDCGEAYRLRYAKKHQHDAKELRFKALRAIAAEHPKHSDIIPLR